MMNEMMVDKSFHVNHHERKAYGYLSSVDEDDDDFLPTQAEFILACRDRAFSWDVNFEEGIHGEGIHILHGAELNTGKPNSVSKGVSLVLKDEKLIVDDSIRLLSKNSEGSAFTQSNKAMNNSNSNHHSSSSNSNSSSNSSNSSSNSSIITTNHNNLVLNNANVLNSNNKSLHSKIVPIEDFTNPLLQEQNHMSLGEIFQLDREIYLDATESTISPKIKVEFIVDVTKTIKNEFPTPEIKSRASNLVDSTPSFSTGERKLGVYTKEERRQRIDRFRQKKMNRIWKKQIKYDCRKRLADTRPRIKGRFVSRGSPDHSQAMNENEERLVPLPLSAVPLATSHLLLSSHSTQVKSEPSSTIPCFPNYSYSTHDSNGFICIKRSVNLS